LYEGEVSAPDGDRDDWVRFRLYGSEVAFRIKCSGNSTLAFELQRDGRAVQGVAPLACGQQMSMNLEPGGAPYTLLISAVPVEGKLVLIRYSLRIANRP
jgi:hypothetical protein